MSMGIREESETVCEIKIRKMKTIFLMIKEKECTDTICPLPLELIPNVEKAIKKITYDKKTEKAEIVYDESKISEEGIVNKLNKIGHKVQI